MELVNQVRDGGNRSRTPRPVLRAAGAGLLLCAAAGCGDLVSGSPVAETAAVVRHIDTPLAQLLPTPAQFPPRYPAVVLPAQAAVAAAGDLDGVGQGARVDPPGCTPPESEPGEDRTAVAVGTDDASRATLTVELARTNAPLGALRAQLAACPTMTVERAGAGSTVTTTLDTRVPVGADDAISLRRTVVPAVGGRGLTQTMQTSVGQIGDVRITVTSMTFGDGAVDAAAVDDLFATAVRTVRR